MLHVDLPQATHYTLGGGSVVVEVWQPFPDTAADGVVAASFRGALFSLYRQRVCKSSRVVKEGPSRGCVKSPVLRHHLVAALSTTPSVGENMDDPCRSRPQ